ncbi:MAG: hypothetical protein KGM47_13570 [Acidobacteriota bacterium]|nr:hypothetical protein [Acidobacteriota bacterium]
MKHHDLEHLETQVKKLRGSLARLADDRDLQELLIIFRRPGWTTPAEYALVAGVVNSLHAQVEALMGLRQILVTGSQAVGESIEINPQPLPPKEIGVVRAAAE